MGFKCGIVGLPNVGKSTLFNALTQTAAAEAANFPFCTIEPNIGKVGLKDERLLKLATIASSQKIIPTQMEFVDIAGLVKGASTGEGLGNKFLAHIREVDAIAHVLRCFNDDEVMHVQDHVDPVRDMEIIEEELLLADLTYLEGTTKALEKRVRITKDPQDAKSLELAKKFLQALNDGISIRNLLKDLNDEEKGLQRQFCLLSAKPMMYVCNVGEDEVVNGNSLSDAVKSYLEKFDDAEVNIISASIEAEIAALPGDEDKQAFLADIGLSKSGIDAIMKSGYELLGLITYFTVGPKEARAWTVKKGSLAPQAAGVIHGDFEHGFICAETINWQEYLQAGGESNAKAQGKLRQEGRNYEVKDGDVMHFLFNV